MEIGNNFKCKVKFIKQFYPKDTPVDNSWGVCTFKIVEHLAGIEPVLHPIYRTFTAKGTFPKLEVGKEYTMVGTEGEENQYGKQYEAITIFTPIDINRPEIVEEFVRAILTEKEANALVETFGDNLGKVLNQGEVSTLTKAKGVGQAVATKIIDKFQQRLDNAKAYLGLGELGFKSATIERLCLKVGGAEVLMSEFKKNPYFLIGYDGFGFKKADQIAIMYGIKPDSVCRVKAFIIYYLKESMLNGHSYITTEDLIFSIEEYLGDGLSQDSINQAKTELLQEQEIWVNSHGDLVALKDNYWLEYNIMKELVRINSAPNNFVYDNWEQIIKEAEKEQGFNFTEEQLKGIESGLKGQVNIIIGKAGTGKSSVVKGCLAPLGKYEFSCCALSGRASANLSEYTGEEGYTIHRLLGYNPLTGLFDLNHQHQLDLDGVVLDEAGMVDARMFYSLIQAIPTGAKLFILGDIGQLESIGVGNILKDMIESNKFNVVELTKIHRQAQKSGVISESSKIYEGKQIIDKSMEGIEVRGELQDFIVDITKDKDTIFDKIMKHYKEQSKVFKNVMDVQVVVPMKTRGGISCARINKAIQEYLMEKRIKKGFGKAIPYMTVGSMARDSEGKIDNSKVTKIYVGDKVINMKNNYETSNVDGKKVPIFNGNLGIVEEVYIDENNLKNQRKGARKMVVDFGETIGRIVLLDKDIDNIQLAYAVTTHKCQGSSAPCIICGLDTSAFKMLTKEMLYTMITRTKTLGILVGENKAIRIACRTSGVRDRNTFLCNMLLQFYNTIEKEVKQEDQKIRQLGKKVEKEEEE